MRTKLIAASAGAAVLLNMGIATLAAAQITPGGGDVPTTTQDCKNGQWVYLSDGTSYFKNQGDCVSYVSTDGSNLAAGAPVL
jgi:predicted RecA/RadA family phage recombinase